MFSSIKTIQLRFNASKSPDLDVFVAIFRYFTCVVDSKLPDKI